MDGSHKEYSQFCFYFYEANQFNIERILEKYISYEKQNSQQKSPLFPL